MSDLPTGTVTFLFTDIEGSTTRWEHHPDAMRTALARHDTLLRSVITAHGGFVFKMVGDAVYAAFAVAPDAVSAALAAQRAVAAEEWGEVAPLRVRVALHTGAAQSRDDDYFGPTLNRVARVLSTGSGGQTLLSTVTYELVRDSLPDGTGVKDLGEHALKDLLRPEHVFQLTASGLLGEFPPLKSLSCHVHNLPVQPTALIGREQEVATLCDLLRRPQVRLVTLTGPGGIGKTRLGLQVAAELAEQFPDGTFFVPLAPVSDPEQVVPTILQTLSISETANQPLLVRLQSVLKDKHLLLLVDNFEQVVQAAVVIAELLAACPRLKILVTSRVVLHVRAEREYAVPALSLPNLKRLPDLPALSQYEAVALFIERAQAVKPKFQVSNANAPAVAGICARLDGLPLAIELAAARVKYFPPQTLLARLQHGLAVLSGGARDLPARQQTLRATLAWSYDLLVPEEQQLFRRLAVFVDGCTIEAAEAVCMAVGVLQGDILEGLASLVDKSLLRQQESMEGEPRFWMLQLLREFGLESLAGAGETELMRQAHAEYYLALAEEAEHSLRGAEQARWLARLEQEQENLRAALSFLLEGARMQAGTPQGQEQAERALRFWNALYWFWHTRGYLQSQAFLEQALALRSGVAASVQARALLAAGDLALQQDYNERAEALAGESLALYRNLADKQGIAACLVILGWVSCVKSQYVTALALHEEATRLFQAQGDTWEVARCLYSRGRICRDLGEYEQARMLLEQSLGLYRTLGDQDRIGWVLSHLAHLLFFSQEDPAKAQTLAEQSLAILKELGSMTCIPAPLGLLGQMSLKRGEWTLARTRLEESLAICQEIGSREDAVHQLLALARVAVAQGDLTAAHRRYQECLALQQELDNWEWLPAILEGMAAMVAGEGMPLKAVEMWGAAAARREAIGTPMHPVYRADYEQAVAAVRRELGEEAFAAAWNAGRMMPLEQVINEALKIGHEAGKQ